MLQVFDVEIRDRKGSENMIANHLSGLTINDETLAMQKYDTIHDSLPYEQLFKIDPIPWYVNIVNYLACGILKDNISYQDRKIFLFTCRSYFWDDIFLFRIEKGEIIRHCIPESDQRDVLSFCDEYNCGGHFGGRKTTFKVLQSGIYWSSLFKDAHEFYISCDRCQRTGNIGKRNEMS